MNIDPKANKTVRCAIYTRVSTDEQAGKEYNSLEAQKEICEHYIQLHKEEHWVFANTYEDPGYSGSNLERPGVQELLEDIKSNKIDVVITYKIDRISRSLKDFYQFWGILKDYNIIFVSATQSFDTSSSTGMLMLNVLMSFAQFERELTMERTMAKLAMRASKGKWNGGWTPTGYDYDKKIQLLTPNKEESEMIRIIFRMASEEKKPSVIKKELFMLGYKTKKRQIMARGGKIKAIGGNRLNEDSITNIILNPVYKGYIRFDNKIFKGEHKAIINPKLWDNANKIIKKPVKTEIEKDDHIHLLKGILKCGDCGFSMTPYPAGKKDKNGIPYLYYSCTSVSKEGKGSDCNVRTLPAREFENIIKSTLKDLGKNKAILENAIKSANQEANISIKPLLKKQKQQQEDINKRKTEINNITDVIKKEGVLSKRLKEESIKLDAEREELEKDFDKTRMDIERIESKVINTDVIKRSLEQFDKVIESLSLEDQKELIQLLIKEIVVFSFDPKKEPQPKEKGCFTTQIRTKWYKVYLSINQIPDLDRYYNNPNSHKGSSDSNSFGSPAWTRTRNPSPPEADQLSLGLTVLVRRLSGGECSTTLQYHQ